eukprot:15461298-Alexandrium_andersonii.AAC.1
MVADSWVWLQGPAAQRPGSSLYAARSVHIHVEGVAQAWANGRPQRPGPAPPTVQVDPPDGGRLAE